MFKASGYDHRVAQFGMPQYGGSMAQNVYYANSNWCGKEDDVDPSRDNDLTARRRSGVRDFGREQHGDATRIDCFD